MKNSLKTDVFIALLSALIYIELGLFIVAFAIAINNYNNNFIHCLFIILLIMQIAIYNYNNYLRKLFNKYTEKLNNLPDINNIVTRRSVINDSISLIKYINNDNTILFCICLFIIQILFYVYYYKSPITINDSMDIFMTTIYRCSSSIFTGYILGKLSSYFKTAKLFKSTLYMVVDYEK